MGSPISLDRYAELQAEIASGRPRDEVLGQAGMSLEEWSDVQRDWLDRMGHELALGGFDLTNRYTRVLLQRRRALAAEAVAAAAPHEAPTVAEPAPEATPATAPAEATPSYLLPGAPMRAVKRALAALSGTSLSLILPKRPPLPFVPGAGAAIQPEPSRPSPAPAVERSPALSGTSLGTVVPPGPALPFVKEAATTPPPTPPAAPEAAPAVKRAPAALSGTSLEVIAPKRSALPFAHFTATTPLPPPSGASSGPPSLDRSPEPPEPGRLSLEQYASLCVELAADPAKNGETLRRYQLTPDQHKEVAEHWQGRIAAEPAVWMAFDRASTAYRTWFLASRSR
jgi:hypothetical protein